MARRRNTTTIREIMVTPTSGVRQSLTPINFGSYIPGQSRSILVMKTKINMLWFSEISAFTSSKLDAQISANSNRAIGKGLTLAYEPPHQYDGKIVVKLTTEDIKVTDSYSSATLICYVLGYTPYDKSMEKYLTAMWNFVKKPQILYHTDGYYIF
ncbi:hypothetical protein KY290_026841 [Solanum tuberosum]|uniref:Capsid protein n=1 Tax=Solanum tuberosum TaxID=4113 RepID=A0ABQ7UXP0_SOLTU|nr:hypothetical protein KY289_025119 [Solanum tuberosum]KAH0677167.1 hypothetical protein KY285_024968 [Solanum tuberosum]KAH0687877.1 hypothetical protein KY284_018430 [Solanum tuberosum]KAH0756571.1 hypothetical protein KY290_026841 [Solanum tuberosum]